MYIPNHFREDDRAKLIEFMRANSFGILVTQHSGAPFATHLPLVVEADDNDDAIILKGHIAKANPQWHDFANAAENAANESLIIFHGPHAYISPSNYESRQSVPTWNYIAVHAYGVPRIVDTKEPMLAAMIEQYEPAHQQQWHEQTEKYKSGMLNAIVAFEMAVTRLEGKYKLSQNRPEVDQQRVIDSLSKSDDPTIRGIADHMRAAHEPNNQ